MTAEIKKDVTTLTIKFYEWQLKKGYSPSKGVNGYRYFKGFGQKIANSTAELFQLFLKETQLPTSYPPTESEGPE